MGAVSAVRHIGRRAAPARLAAWTRGWAVWELPAWLSAFIVTATAAYAAALLAAGVRTPAHGADIRLFAELLGFAVVTVELTRRAGAPAGMTSDMFTVWYLPIAVLLPPLYGLAAPAPIYALTQWRVRQTLPYRRVFSAATVGLSYGAASLAFHALIPAGTGPGTGLAASRWVALAGLCAALRWLVNSSLVVTAIKGAEPTSRLRDLWWGRELLRNDFTELCVGLVVTFAVAADAALIVISVPFVTLLQRSARHAQLVNQARIDPKTGLINAGTWQREAHIEISRAARTLASLSVAIIDIDHFKAVNDTYGHLAGDRVLAATADALRLHLRGYDLIGRFGGEEFTVLLPHTGAAQAREITERLRGKIADQTILTGQDGAAGQHPVSVTVSIGIAGLGADCRDLTSLLAAADAALYEAKHTGRNRVCVVPAGQQAAAELDPAMDEPG
jgi:diguanylate cyclase (GGDEF)-like protein